MSYISDLEQLVLEHQRAIEIYEARLDELQGVDELQAHMIRSQIEIEFCLLIVRSLALGKQARRMEAYEEAARNAPNSLNQFSGPFHVPPMPGRALARVVDAEFVCTGCGRPFDGERPETLDAPTRGAVAKQ